jgi:hypothetical protein
MPRPDRSDEIGLHDAIEVVAPGLDEPGDIDLPRALPRDLLVPFWRLRAFDGEWRFTIAGLD